MRMIFVVWHGSTGQGMGKEQNAGLLAGVFALTSELKYINIKRHVIGWAAWFSSTGWWAGFTDGKEVPRTGGVLW